MRGGDVLGCHPGVLQRGGSVPQRFGGNVSSATAPHAPSSTSHGSTYPSRVPGCWLLGWGGGKGLRSPVLWCLLVRPRRSAGAGEQQVPHNPSPDCDVGSCSHQCGSWLPGEHPQPRRSPVPRAPGTHAVVAAPARLGVRCLRHLHGAVALQVAHAAQAAVVVHAAADTAGEEALGGPHLTDLAHLIIDNLGRDGQPLIEVEVRVVLGMWAWAVVGQREWEGGIVWNTWVVGS